MAKRDETVAEREWHELKAELLGRPRESLDLFDIERSIHEHLSAMGRELMTASSKRRASSCTRRLAAIASISARMYLACWLVVMAATLFFSPNRSDESDRRVVVEHARVTDVRARDAL